MSDPDLTSWEESDRHLHQSDGRGYCLTCSTRMPCDWSVALDDMKRAADRIVELEAALREIDEMERTVIWRCSPDCWSSGGPHTEQCKQIDKVGDIARRALEADDD